MGKDRSQDGCGVMLLIHKDFSHMPITELENNSESVWVKVFANKTSHFIASLYHHLTELESQLKSFESQLEKIKDIHKGNKPPQSMFLGISTSVLLFGQIDSTNQIHRWVHLKVKSSLKL